jgi:LmbE family N-acetylglucosaminyl deacetylase
MTSAERPPDNHPGRILVVLAHPDDPDFFCGGSIARWADEGSRIHYCLLTRGDKGSDDVDADPAALARTREAEQQAAAEALGVCEVRFLDYPDGYVVPDLAMRKEVVRVIRQIQPDTLVTCDPTNYFPNDRYINHPDHRAAGQVALDAVFPAAGSGMFFPELARDEGLQPHKVRQVYVSMAEHPNTAIDVTDYIDRKVAALRRHVSQIGDPDKLEARIRERLLDPQSPPGQPRYFERFRLIDMSR